MCRVYRIYDVTTQKRPKKWRTSTGTRVPWWCPRVPSPLCGVLSSLWAAGGHRKSKKCSAVSVVRMIGPGSGVRGDTIIMGTITSLLSPCYNNIIYIIIIIHAFNFGAQELRQISWILNYNGIEKKMARFFRFFLFLLREPAPECGWVYWYYI